MGRHTSGGTGVGATAEVLQVTATWGSARLTGLSPAPKAATSGCSATATLGVSVGIGARVWCCRRQLLFSVRLPSQVSRPELQLQSPQFRTFWKVYTLLLL